MTLDEKIFKLQDYFIRKMSKKIIIHDFESLELRAAIVR